MKIAIISSVWRDLTNQPGGGIECYVYNIAGLLKSFGHDVTIFATDDSEDSVNGVPVVKMGEYSKVYYEIHGQRGKRLSYKTISESIQGDFDIVINNLLTGSIVFNLAKKYGKRLFNVIHAIPYGIGDYSFYKSQIDTIKEFGYHYIAVSDFVKDHLINEMKPYCHVYYPYYQSDDVADFIYPFNEKKKRIITVSRICEQKRFSLFLDTVKDLNHEILVIGDRSNYNQADIDTYTRLEELVKIKPNIKWINKMSNKEVLKEISKSSLFLLASKEESFSLVTAESCSVGTRVLVLSGLSCGGPNYIKKELNNTESIIIPDMGRIRYETLIENLKELINTLMDSDWSEEEYNKLVQVSKEKFNKVEYYNNLMKILTNQEEV